MRTVLSYISQPAFHIVVGERDRIDADQIRKIVKVWLSVRPSISSS